MFSVLKYNLCLFFHIFGFKFWNLSSKERFEVQKVALRRCVDWYLGVAKEVWIYARLPVKQTQEDFKSVYMQYKSVYMQYIVSEDQHSTMDVISNVSIEIMGGKKGQIVMRVI